MTVGIGYQCLALEFGADETACVNFPGGIQARLAIPCATAARTETLCAIAGRVEEHGLFRVHRWRDQLAGIAILPTGGDMQTVSFRCYQELFALLEDSYHLYRAWHYVPGINESKNGLENYRRFNIGRSEAFHEWFGAAAELRMPAASAVGVSGNALVMVFRAGSAVPRYVENPEQTPSYHYPSQYGPRPPSFARATVYEDADGKHAYISGTASIKGHETLAIGRVEEQFHITLDNLEIVARQLGLPDWKAATALPDYHHKVYLRRQRDWPRVSSLCAKYLGTSETDGVVLITDICRRDLDIEIEACFTFQSNH